MSGADFSNHAESKASSSARFDVPRRYPTRLGREHAVLLPKLSEDSLADLFRRLVGNSGSSALVPRLDEAAAREIFLRVPGLSTVGCGLDSGNDSLDESCRQGELRILKSLEALLCALWGLDGCLVGLAGESRLASALEAIRAFHENFGSNRSHVLLIGDQDLQSETSQTIRGAGYEPLFIESLSTSLVSAAIDVHGFSIAALYTCIPRSAADLSDIAIFAECAEIVQGRGVQVVLEGSGLRSLHGVALPRDLGSDLVVADLAELLDFSPEGTGTGAVAARVHLAPFLTGRAEARAEIKDTATAATALALLYFEGEMGLRKRAEEYALKARCHAAGLRIPEPIEMMFTTPARNTTPRAAEEKSSPAPIAGGEAH